MDATARIKNLSIALEALSRINHPAAGNLFEAIEGLLDKAIHEERKTATPPARPATTTSDDDIPF